MGNILLTAAQIAAGNTPPGLCEILNVKLAEAVTAGQVLYWTTTGTMGIADGDENAKDEPMAVALEPGGAGQVISVLKRGFCAGFTVAAVNVGAKLTLTNTPGVMESDGSGEKCGVVWANSNAVRVAYFDFEPGQAGVS